MKEDFISKCKCVSLNVEVGRLFINLTDHHMLQVPCEQGVC